MRAPGARALTWPTAGVALALLLALSLAGVAARSGPWTSTVRVTPATAAPAPTQAAPAPTTKAPAESKPQPQEQPHSRILRWALLACAVVVAAAALLLAWRLRPRWRRRWHRWTRSVDPDVQAAPQDETVIVTAVDHALLLLADPDAREVVVRAWLLLGAAAAAAGTPSRPTETSRDYARRLAASRGLPLESVERLAGLYREARFSAHEVRDDQREQARAELLTLRAALQRGSATSMMNP